MSEPKLQINFSKSLIRLHAFCFSFRFAILGKKTVGTRIDRVPNVIVAGVCLFNFALDQGEDPDMQEDPELGDEHEEDPGEDFVLAETEGARLAQGTAHREWLVERYCQNYSHGQMTQTHKNWTIFEISFIGFLAFLEKLINWKTFSQLFTYKLMQIPEHI